MFEEMQAEADMGMKAITVQIGFPILDVNFYIFQGETAAQAQQSVQTWLDYYKSVVQAVHDLGLKLIVQLTDSDVLPGG